MDSELTLWQCMVCDGNTQSKYVIKPEATEEYLNAVQGMMDLQKDLTGIERYVAHDLLHQNLNNNFLHSGSNIMSLQ